MTVTAVRSAFPPDVEALMPQARALAAELGAIPSQNMLKKALRVGAEKAKVVRGELLAASGAGSVSVSTPPVPPAGPVVDEVPPAPAAELVTPVQPVTVDAPAPEPAPAAAAPVDVPPPAAGASLPFTPARAEGKRVRSWPVLLLALPAFVAIWSGWVGLGELTGFGMVHPLPGIADRLSINSAITLPIGVETYAAYALRVWLSGQATRKARRFAMWSAIGSLVFGAAGQVAYHLMSAAGVTHAPWQITTLVASLPVAVLGMGAALAHLIGRQEAGQ